LNGVFTAATAGVGQHLINYTYVDPVSLCSFTTTTQIRVVALPPPPTAIGASGCQLTNLALVASGANIGESYRWYTVASGGSPIAGATLAAFTTPPLTATTSYYVSIVSEGGCEGPRAEVVATVATVTKPAITTSGSPSFCTSGSIVLTAPVGFTSYEWSTGETTPSITVTAAANYTVRVRNTSGCESEVSDPVTVTINQPPPKPQIAVTGNLAICAGQSTTLSAPNGFTYSWSTGATTQSITATTAANYTVRVRNASGCESEVSDPVTVTINQPPPTPQIVVTGDLAICAGQSTTLSAPSGFTYSWSTGATTQEIVVTTADTFSVTIADANSCSATSATVATTLIDCVTDDLIVYNAISPNADLKNEKWIIENIDARPDTQQNQVTIYNRWGDVVWEGKNYDNTTVVFTGLSKGGSELPSGTYFYKIDFSQRGAVRGFLILKR
jgi:gliding motility-associated-like protein